MGDTRAYTELLYFLILNFELMIPLAVVRSLINVDSYAHLIRETVVYTNAAK
jgi:hypothetical protein